MRDTRTHCMWRYVLQPALLADQTYRFHCEQGLFVADLRKMKGDRARLLHLKATCLESQSATEIEQGHAATSESVSTLGVEASMQKVYISKEPDNGLHCSPENTQNGAMHVRRMAEDERDKILQTMGEQIPSDISEAEVYNRLCCLYHR